MTASKKFDIDKIYRLLRRFLMLNIENARLSLTERLTLLFGMIGFSLFALILCSIGFVFVTAAVAHLLSDHMGMQWVYLIVAAIYFGITALVFVFRRALIYDPICRFLSRIILPSPEDKKDQTHLPVKTNSSES